MNTTKKHNPGDTICTCRVGEDRYEIKTAERLICGTLSETVISILKKRVLVLQEFALSTIFTSSKSNQRNINEI